MWFAWRPSALLRPRRDLGPFILRITGLKEFDEGGGELRPEEEFWGLSQSVDVEFTGVVGRRGGDGDTECEGVEIEREEVGGVDRPVEDCGDERAVAVEGSLLPWVGDKVPLEEPASSPSRGTWQMVNGDPGIVASRGGSSLVLRRLTPGPGEPGGESGWSRKRSRLDTEDTPKGDVTLPTLSKSKSLPRFPRPAAGTDECLSSLPPRVELRSEPAAFFFDDVAIALVDARCRRLSISFFRFFASSRFSSLSLRRRSCGTQSSHLMMSPGRQSASTRYGSQEQWKKMCWMNTKPEQQESAIFQETSRWGQKRLQRPMNR